MSIDLAVAHEVPIGNGNFDHHVGEEILEMAPLVGEVGFRRWCVFHSRVCRDAPLEYKGVGTAPWCFFFPII